MLLLTLLGCSIGGNNPPRFKSFNDKDVTYIFGFAILEGSLSGAIPVTAGQRYDMEIKVTDSNGDDIELLFPLSPEGLHFDSRETTGYWDVPTEPINQYLNMQILAVDENGAVDSLYVPFSVEGYQWDTGWYGDSMLYGLELQGDANVENGFHGTLLVNVGMGCVYTWPETHGVAFDSTTTDVPSCRDCEKTWSIELGQGQFNNTMCENSIRDYYGSDILDAIENTPTLYLGWSQEATIDGVHYQQPMFLYSPMFPALSPDIEPHWVPNGQGTLQNQRLTFSLSLY